MKGRFAAEGKEFLSVSRPFFLLHDSMISPPMNERLDRRLSLPVFYSTSKAEYCSPTCGFCHNLFFFSDTLCVNKVISLRGRPKADTALPRPSLSPIVQWSPKHSRAPLPLDQFSAKRVQVYSFLLSILPVLNSAY